MATKKELEDRIRENERQIKDLWKDIGILSNQIGQMKKTSKEPDYLQVGDQWRDEEGNEYVLAVLCDGIIRYFALVNKSWGGTLGYIKDTHGMTYLANNGIVRERLGITNSMTKIK